MSLIQLPSHVFSFFVNFRSHLFFHLIYEASSIIICCITSIFHVFSDIPLSILTEADDGSKQRNSNSENLSPTHVIRIRLLHPLEIGLVAFRIYDICTFKHILSKYMIIIDYYMAFFILHVISTGDTHISTRAEVPRAYIGRGLIWHVI